MLQNHYRNLAITFFISTLWCIYVFFDYFPHQEVMLPELTLFFHYTAAMMFVFLCSLIVLIIRLTKYKLRILNSFWYTFIACSNLLLFVVYTCYVIFTNQVTEFFVDFDILNALALLQFILTVLLLVDLYRNFVFSLKKDSGKH